MNQPRTPTNFQIMLHYIHPWLLLGGALTYALGGGIAKYLGHSLSFSRFWVGLLLVVLMQLASYILKQYYDLVDASGPLRRIQDGAGDIDQIAASRLSRPGTMLLAFTILTVGAVLTVLMVAQGAVQFPGLVILGVAFLLAFCYGVPPFRLVYRGYGELTEAILITSLFPAFGYILQTGDLHRLLLVVAFPLLALFIAMRMAQSLEHYLHDQELAHRTMMVVLGWQRGMQAHNLFILLGYLLLVVAAAFGGLPWQLTWPGLLSLPVGLFQIYQMTQIAGGAKPPWRVLRLTSTATFALTAYLMALAFWTR